MKKTKLYQGVTDKKGKEVDFLDVFDAIKYGKWGLAEHQQAVRNCADDAKRQELKAQTLAITPSGLFSKRSDSALVEHSGFLNFDIDHVSDIQLIFDTVGGDEHTFAIWRSISGEGITGLFRVADGMNRSQHREAYLNMINYFSENYGIDIDQKCKNVGRLRFLSFDENLEVYEDAALFTYKRPKVKSQVRRKFANYSSSASFAEFNANTDCVRLLESFGWTKLYTVGGKTRMTRPGGSKGQNHGEVFADNKFNSYTEHEVIPSERDKPVSAFDILLHYKYSGDYDQAKADLFPHLVKKSGWTDEVPLPSEPPPMFGGFEAIETPKYEGKQSKTVKIKDRENKEITLPTFPVNSLPENYQNIIAAVSNALDTPPDLLACSMMMAASTAVGNSVRLKLANGWKQSCALFMALIGDSAAGKSPAIDFAFNYLRSEDARLVGEYKVLKQEYDLAQMDKETRGSVPKPTKKEYILEESTIESTLKTLSDNPFGVAAVIDELAGWINGMNQYKSKGGSEEKKWLTIFDNRALKKSTVGRGTDVILSPYVSVVGGIQPKILHEIAKDGRNYDGFMFRFCFCVSEQRKPKSWEQLVKSAIPDEITESWEKILQVLLSCRDYVESTRQTVAAAGDDPTKVFFEIPLNNDTPAGKLWAKWYNGNIREIEEARAAEKEEQISALTKLSIMCSRLILLNEMMIVSEGGKYTSEISEQAVKSAIKQIEYFKATAFYAFDLIAEQKADNSRQINTRCDWRKIFITQEEVDEGLLSGEIVNRVMAEFGKAEKTAKNWIAADLKPAPKREGDSKRVRRYTL